MARAVWSGAISFGLVNVPVKAYSATRDHDIHFHQVEAKTGAWVRYRKVSEKSGREVPADDIDLSYELGSGRSVRVDPGELEELRPRTTKTINVADFVDLHQIDPVYYDRTYWLGPDGAAAERAYRLLEASMEASEKVGIGTVVMRNKQYLAAIRPLDGALALSTLRFADEVVPKSDVDDVPSRQGKPDAKELRLATQIIDSLTTDWEPERYHDTYTEELRDLIERRARGEQVEVDEAEARPTKVVDLMEALQASIDAARKGRAAPSKGAARTTKAGSTTKAATSKATARKATAAKKSTTAEKATTATKAPARRSPPARSGKGSARNPKSA